jgi:Dyp-type peroxidase family
MILIIMGSFHNIKKLKYLKEIDLLLTHQKSEQSDKFVSINLSEVQGNILKGFNKDHARFIFFNIEDAQKISDWFRELVEQKKIPSTTDLIDAATRMKGKWKYDPTFKPRETWIHVAFTASGIKKFGLDLPPSHGAYELDEPDPSNPDPDQPADGQQIFLKHPNAVVDDSDPFNAGMKKRNTTLGDIENDDPKNWSEPFNNKYDSIDGVIRIDADEIEDVNKTVVDLITQSTQRGSTVLGLEIGDTILNRQGKQIEHFGFRDGVSQPLIKGIDDEESGKRTIEIDLHNPKKFVLFNLEGTRAWANGGSFLVFRRLSQDFAGFWEFMKEYGPKFGFSPTELAARFVGRWPTGAPLAKFQDGDPLLPGEFDDNDFKYIDNTEAQTEKIDPQPPKTHPELDDKDGSHTPRFAHIRKVYPRDDGITGNKEKDDDEADKHRILRRGIAFGPRFEDVPDAERGLLFYCHQVDLETQFEFVQTQWANNPNFPKKPTEDPTIPNGEGHGVDAIIGKHHGTGFDNLLQNGSFKRIDGFKQWVTTTGGQYFFSPSIPALRGGLKK